MNANYLKQKRRKEIQELVRLLSLYKLTPLEQEKTLKRINELEKLI